MRTQRPVRVDGGNDGGGNGSDFGDGGGYDCHTTTTVTVTVFPRRRGVFVGIATPSLG